MYSANLAYSFNTYSQKHIHLIIRPGKPEDHIAAEELPLAFDWRNVDGVNYVSPIRNQKGCGSCYAFGTMAMFEARSRIKSNNSLQYVLAPQDIVSCSEYSQGCEGGNVYSSLFI